MIVVVIQLPDLDGEKYAEMLEELDAIRAEAHERGGDVHLVTDRAAARVLRAVRGPA